MSFYDRVRGIKEQEVLALRDSVPELRLRIRAQPSARSLKAALQAQDPAFIAEIKRASPSRGVLRADLDAAAHARRYEAGGAAAVSVLTERVYFHGSLDDLAAVKDAVALPVLRKDFILDPLQITAARAFGADAVLLIAGFLEEALLRDLVEAARGEGLEALVEIHEERELDAALSAGAELIGINNRNLRDLRVDLAVGEALIGRVPAGCVGVIESGIHGPQDVARLRRAGARAFLVGERLSTADRPEDALRELRGGQG